MQNNEDFHSVPSSPPPSFRSRASSPTSRHLLASEDPLVSEADRTLADTFDDGSASDTESNDGGDDRQRLMRANTIPPTESQTTTVSDGSRPLQIQRTVTEFPGATPVAPGATRGMPYSTFTASNDGVFANLSAKPERGEKQEEEKPPVRSLPFRLPWRELTHSPSSHTKPQRQTLLLPTGKPPSSLPVSTHPTKSTSKVSPSALSSASFGTV